MKKLILLLLVFTSLNAFAQYRDLYFEHLNVLDGLPESMHAQKWLNLEDFGKALAIAREHYPQPRRKAAAVAPAIKSKTMYAE